MGRGFGFFGFILLFSAGGDVGRKLFVKKNILSVRGLYRFVVGRFGVDREICVLFING